VAKCLITDPDIIIIDEPTVGIDVKTKAEIHRLIYELAGQGKSIIMISSDLPELIQIAERILIFSDNKIVGELDNMKDYDIMSTKVMASILKN
jgi:ribose transport system ATP-binding protein